jgi:hypothetical protein
MTATATLVQRGPINGTFSEHAGLYALSVPYAYEGEVFDHLIVSTIPADEYGPEDTVALAAYPDGRVVLGGDFPYELEGAGGGHAEALEALGYTLAGE